MSVQEFLQNVNRLLPTEEVDKMCKEEDDYIERAKLINQCKREERNGRYE